MISRLDLITWLAHGTDSIDVNLPSDDGSQVHESFD